MNYVELILIKSTKKTIYSHQLNILSFNFSHILVQTFFIKVESIILYDKNIYLSYYDQIQSKWWVLSAGLQQWSDYVGMKTLVGWMPLWANQLPSVTSGTITLL